LFFGGPALILLNVFWFFGGSIITGMPIWGFFMMKYTFYSVGLRKFEEEQ
jgi:hypothetical protein